MTKPLRAIPLLVLLLVMVATVVSAQKSGLAARRAKLREALEQEWQYTLRTSPELATGIGDPRYNDRWSDYSAAAQEKQTAHGREEIRVFAAIDTAGFPEQETLNRTLMLRQLRESVEGARFKDWEMPVDQMNGIQLGIPGIMTQMPLKTVKDFENYVARLHGIPGVLDQVTVNMRQGMADHLMPPRYLLEKVAAQSEDIATKPLTSSPFAEPLQKFPKDFAPSDTARLTLAIQGAIHNEVNPAYAKFAAFVKNEYAPQGRTDPGVWALPDGVARYRFAVREQTTTDMTPEQIHAMGVKQVAEIEADMLKLAQSLGYHDLKSFNEHIRKDPDLYGKSGQQFFDLYKKYALQMEAKLPDLFGHLPKTRLEVIPMEVYREPSAPPADYSPGAADGSRPGYINVNEYDPTHRLTLNVEAIAYHEGVPGHHLQFSIAQEQTGVPEFRKFSDYNAYSEGWAFYSERLGKEVGFYQDPYSEYGRLENDMWRSVRWVVDTGVHSQHWTRQQMVDYFHDHTAMDDTNIASEVDRYIAWPGQALAYKMGQLKILELRARAKKELGAKFDIRSFHDAVLGQGALPLDVLDAQITKWIAEQKWAR
ncbi:MAG TPA: DUF885 domain-containing protein [Acidobacteriaceae bacterium]|nr:DUF885 domain-containing protein [Acidobacteriaceae bacterium]